MKEPCVQHLRGEDKKVHASMHMSLQLLSPVQQQGRRKSGTDQTGGLILAVYAVTVVAFRPPDSIKQTRADV